MGLLFLPLMFVVLYFLLIRPQQKRVREQQSLQRAVEVGDEILTTSGLYGILTAMDDEDIWIEIADNIEVRMARGAVLRRTQAAEVVAEPLEHPGEIEAAEEVDGSHDVAEPTHDEKK